MAKYYIWKYARSGGATNYFVTDTRVIEENTPFEYVSYYNGAWHGSFEEIGDNGLYFTNVSIDESNLKQVGQVDYNKHPFTGDLIVEWVNKRGWETWDITYANSDYFGELTCDGDCDEVAQYTCSGPIAEGTGKESLSVRVINVDGEQKDYIFEQTENVFPEAHSMEWWCNDSSCPIYITYADYSGGSPIVLKARDANE